ncbi:hypothetical protein L484_024899 [Morus notabilis]|uniref:Uncharacterized protein n=1 Tax=Morus notabilis TaxID=981085 RepID=W9RRR1_9ROSA|nr:hypothetical protein L484_024899 [Morus notabilis]
MQAQLTTLTALVCGLMTVVERLDGRNSMPPLEDAPRPQGLAVAGDPNYGDHPHIQEGTGDSENHRGPPRPRPSQSPASRLGRPDSELPRTGYREVQETPRCYPEADPTLREQKRRE